MALLLYTMFIIGHTIIGHTLRPIANNSTGIIALFSRAVCICVLVQIIAVNTIRIPLSSVPPNKSEI